MRDNIRRAMERRPCMGETPMPRSSRPYFSCFRNCFYLLQNATQSFKNNSTTGTVTAGLCTGSSSVNVSAAMPPGVVQIAC